LEVDLLALVLSGAANYGAMQAGALEALASCGYQPEMVVGTSAGALNAIFIASNPTVDGARQLGALWEAFGASQAIRFSRLTSVRQLLTRKNSLIPNESLVNFLQAQVPLKTKTFGQLTDMHGIHAYTIAVRLEDVQVVAFGDHDDDRLLDGAMASISIPPFFEPWQVDGHQYLDGGIAANLPLRESIERGATQIVAFSVERTISPTSTALDMFGLGRYAISMMVNRQTDLQLNLAHNTGVGVRLIHLPAPQEVEFWDYNQASFLYHLGYQAARKSLNKDPLQLLPVWQLRLRMWLMDRILRISRKNG
jgi:NTE family protein